MTAAQMQPPVLVLAAPGAGSGTLAAALGQNPAAFGLPVLNLETEKTVYDMCFEMSGLRMVQINGVLRALALLLSGEQSLHSVEMARRWLMERLHLPASEIGRWLIQRLAPRRAVIPVGTGLFGQTTRERIASIYPGAALVVVRRHPNSHAQSVMDQAGGAIASLLGASGGSGGQPRMSDPVGLWLKAEDAIAELGELMPESPVHELRIEDVAADPGTALAALAQGLGLEVSDRARAAMATPERSPFAGPGPYGAHLREDIAPFARFGPETAKIHYALPKKAREFGYA